MTAPVLPFTWPVRVYIEDTDAGGIVFYANYLKFMERARTEWARAHGIAMRAELGENISFVVHGLEIRYLHPARLDDQLWVSADVIRFGKTYMDFEQQVGLAGSDDVLVRARIKVACTDLRTGKPRAMPESLRAVLERVG